LKIFVFVIFSLIGQFLLKIEKNENFQKLPDMKKYDFLWSKMTLSGIISTKLIKSPEKFSEVRTAF